MIKSIQGVLSITKKPNPTAQIVNKAKQISHLSESAVASLASPNYTGILNTSSTIIYNVMRDYDFSHFGKNGITLKYPRTQFVSDVWDIVSKEVPEAQRANFLAKFNLEEGQNGILDGVPVLAKLKTRTSGEKKMQYLIEKFYQNEIMIPENLNTEAVLNKILKRHPEFVMMIGKPQHITHSYSVDIHTLELYRKALNNPIYSALSDDGKLILQHAVIMHDYGKKGGIITSGHAKLSKKYAESVLETYKDMSQSMKQRILNLIENHHWFEGYNKGYLSAEDFAKLFPDFEDRQIAVIMAKADFETINPHFHFKRLIENEYLSEEQYEQVIESKMNKLLK